MRAVVTSLNETFASHDDHGVIAHRMQFKQAIAVRCAHEHAAV